MAKIPTPRSWNQILGDMLERFFSRSGIRGLKEGNPVLSIMESAAQSDLRNSYDQFQLLNASSLDNATGLALQRKGRDEGVIQLGAGPSSGTVTIGDSRFEKISTKITPSQPAPITGTDQLHVTSADSFPASGEVYIGRGTRNYEGPLAYSSKVDNGSYWTLVLADNTQRFHNHGETVVLAQGGDRTIQAGQVVKTPQGNTTDAVSFSTRFAATIPDGEVEVTGVQVLAQKPGVTSNVIAGAINSFASVPFEGATVTNPLPFTNGREAESEDEYRERIRAAIQSRAKGTALAILTYLKGIIAQDENKRLTSSSVVSRKGQPTVVYIDDGTGYEESASGVALETLVDLAYGGEEFFQIAIRPVAKAYLLSELKAPFTLSDGAILALKVGGVEYEHTFNASDFKNIGYADAYEVVSSINSNPQLAFQAATAEGGTRVRLFAKADENEDLELGSVDGIDANDAFAFPIGRRDTIRLYRNGLLLSKDGLEATVRSRAFANWGALTNGETLQVRVDGVADATTFTFTNQDFVAAGTGFTTVGKHTPAAWAKVLEYKIPGISVDASTGILAMTSNAGRTDRAKVEILGGTLVSKQVFEAQVAQGRARDYTFNRNTGQIALETPLSEGDSLTAGVEDPRAFLQSAQLPLTTTISSPGANLWFSVDGSAEVVPTTVNGSTNLLTTLTSARRWGNRIRVASQAGADLFADVEIGDAMVLFDAAVNSNMRGTWRVSDIDGAGTYVELDRRNMVSARAFHTSTVLADGRILVAGGYGLGRVPLHTCEIYDPTTQTWTATGSMSRARYAHAAVLLANGNVLVIGGRNDADGLTSCELFDPTTGLWSPAASLPAAKFSLVAGRLASGNVLAAGGRTSLSSTAGETTCYLYDPNANSWTATGSLNFGRYSAAGCVDGSEFFVCGGVTVLGITRDDGEYYSGGVWTLTGNTMSVARRNHAVARLAAGTIVVAGGYDDADALVDSTDTYTSGTHQFTASGDMGTARANHALVTLSDGTTVLAIGGDGVANAETWSAGTWSAAAAPGVTDARSGLSASLTGTAVIVAGGETDPDELFNGFVTAQSERFISSAWSYPSGGVVQSAWAPSESGLVFVRADSDIQKITVPAAANYTAATLAEALETIRGATPSVLNTSYLRVTTDGHGAGSDVALVALDTEAIKLGLQAGDAEENSGSHQGSVESGNSEFGTPSFKTLQVAGSASGSEVVVLGSGVKSNQQLVGLPVFEDSSTLSRWGNNRHFRSQIKSAELLSAASDRGNLVHLRRSAGEWLPGDLVYAASGFALSCRDELTIVANQDVATQRYTLPMWRKGRGSGAYGTTITLKDGDNGNGSLAAAFGLAFDFSDFAVHMSARAKLFPAEANRSSLWKHKRLGPEGDFTAINFIYPDAVDQSVAVRVDPTSQETTLISVVLPSEAALSPSSNIRATTHIGQHAVVDGVTDIDTLTYVVGFSITNVDRADGVVTATVSLPPGMTGHGLQAGDVVYVNSLDINFSSGPKTVTAGGTTTFTYDEAAADDTGTNIGTVSFDAVGEANFSGMSPALAIGHLVRFAANSSLEADFKGFTARVSAVGAQYFQVETEHYDGSNSVGGAPEWSLLGDPEDFLAFQLDTANCTISALVTGVNALGATCPITAALIGNGSGSVLLSSSDEAGFANTHFSMVDGVNYVESVTYPLNSSQDYQLTLKNSVDADLAAGSNWSSEDVRLVPVTTKNLVDWMNSEAVSGLGTSCEVKASDQASRPQISTLTPGSAGAVQVQGGGANSGAATVVGSAIPLTEGDGAVVTVLASDAQSLMGGAWVECENSNAMPKNVGIGATTVLDSIEDGVFTLSVTPIVNVIETATGLRWLVTPQGNFVCYSVPVTSSADPGVDLSTVSEGDWVYIKGSGGAAAMSSLNTGLFRIVRVEHNSYARSFWIENPSADVEQAQADVRFLGADSLMPGDTISISHGLWGDNQGAWTVEVVGGATDDDAFASAFVFKVSGSPADLPSSPGALGAINANLTQVTEGQASKFYKHITSITPNQSDGSYVDVKFDSSAGHEVISAAAGTVIRPLDKLAFSTNVAVGVDGYSYNTGLIAEANRVLYGDARDTATYPAVVAASNVVNISGPLVKRIQVALSIRARSGVSTSDIKDRVKSAVASVVNKTEVGAAIPISNIIKAAAAVNGVVAVSILSPTYNSSNDQISVQPFEKPLVLDLDSDVTVSFVGE